MYEYEILETINPGTERYVRETNQFYIRGISDDMLNDKNHLKFLSNRCKKIREKLT